MAYLIPPSKINKKKENNSAEGSKHFTTFVFSIKDHFNREQDLKKRSSRYRFTQSAKTHCDLFLPDLPLIVFLGLQ